MCVTMILKGKYMLKTFTIKMQEFPKQAFSVIAEDFEQEHALQCYH